MTDVDRWFRTDDTPQWKRAAFRFLVAASIAMLPALLVWWLCSGRMQRCAAPRACAAHRWWWSERRARPASFRRRISRIGACGSLDRAAGVPLMDRLRGEKRDPIRVTLPGRSARPRKNLPRIEAALPRGING